MTATGMCRHNNIAGYCPSCVREKSMRGMGADAPCPEGYYRLKIFGVDTGQCLPTGSTAVSAAQGGVLSSAAAGVAQSQATQTALTNATANTIGNKIVAFYKTKPVMALSLTVGVGVLVLAGLGIVRIPGLSRG